MQYVTLENLKLALAVLGALNVAAALVAKVTPNKTDDKVVAKVQKFLDWVSLSLRKK